MSDKPLRRKGQGETQRPICPHCKQDLDRSYRRSWNKGKRTFKATGWECEECKYKEWDKKLTEEGY